MSDRPTNPKYIQALKDGKAPLEHLVYSVLEGDALVHKSGADKYGIRNWRLSKILTSTYEGAILRHFTAWARGEDLDPDSGVSHLYHIRACCAVLLDSAMCGTLIDDRNRAEEAQGENESEYQNNVGSSDNSGGEGATRPFVGLDSPCQCHVCRTLDRWEQPHGSTGECRSSAVR